MGIPAAPTLLLRVFGAAAPRCISDYRNWITHSQSLTASIILSDKSLVKRTLLIIAFDIELSIAKRNPLYNKFLRRDATFSLPSK